MALYCVVGLVMSFQAELYIISPFLLLYALGFCVMVMSSAGETIVRWQYKSSRVQKEKRNDHISDSELAYREAVGTWETPRSVTTTSSPFLVNCR